MTDPSTLPLVYQPVGPYEVTVEHGELEIYRPSTPGPHPAVVIVGGFPPMFGKQMKDWVSYQGWARLIASTGIAAILYAYQDAVAAAPAAIRAVRARADIDPTRVGAFAASGNAPTALAVVASEHLACAALLYPYLLDLDGATHVADASRRFRFAAPPVALADLQAPLSIVRAGRDALPGLDASLQRFVAAVPAVTLVEHAEGAHGFDTSDDSPAARAAIDQVLAFLARTLT